MTGEESPRASNTISGGIFYGPVLQGRDIQAAFLLPAAAPVALAQLPAMTAGFTGREDEMAVLAGLLDPAGSSGPVVISAVTGPAGPVRPGWNPVGLDYSIWPGWWGLPG